MVRKRASPWRVGHLVSAQKLLADRIEARISYIGVDALGITVPNIDLSIRQRPAVSGAEAHHVKCQRQWRTRRDLPIRGISANVRPMQLFVHEIGTFGLFRTDDTER